MLFLNIFVKYKPGLCTCSELYETFVFSIFCSYSSITFVNKC